MSTTKSILELKGLKMTIKLGLDRFQWQRWISVYENLGVDIIIVSLCALEVE